MTRTISDAVTYHRGISISHIPVEGAAGLFFVFATVFTFAVGIQAVREMLAVTGTLGILGAAILFAWHNRHPLKIHALDLHTPNH